jgi:inosine-uridine nucleoside N-ribohydrolase
MTAPKVILDNDWAITQFIPYLIALDAGWDILGLVSDTSDSWALQTGLHALATLERGGLSDCIPVYRGADYPLLQTPDRFQAYEALLGTLPWEGAFKRENTTAEAEGGDPTSGDPGRIVRAAFEMPYYGYPNATFAEDTPAAMFMVEQVRKYPGEITIYSAGALTNIALAVRMDSIRMACSSWVATWTGWSSRQRGMSFRRAWYRILTSLWTRKLRRLH